MGSLWPRLKKAFTLLSVSDRLEFSYNCSAIWRMHKFSETNPNFTDNETGGKCGGFTGNHLETNIKNFYFFFFCINLALICNCAEESIFHACCPLIAWWITVLISTIYLFYFIENFFVFFFSFSVKQSKVFPTVKSRKIH